MQTYLHIYDLHICRILSPDNACWSHNTGEPHITLVETEYSNTEQYVAGARGDVRSGNARDVEVVVV